jgi:uncharacterized protein (DUF1800 family)
MIAALSGAIGLDDGQTAVAMHRPGKDPIDKSLVDLESMPVTQYVAPPDRVGWLNKTTYGYSTAEDAAFLALPGATMDAKWQNWLNQQLDPASISDTDCTNRIAAAGYTTLNKSLAQLWNDHVLNPADYYARVLPAGETECATIVRAIYSKRQLYERMVNFWHDHFSVFGFDYDIAPIFVHYDRDVIRPNAFGNFRTMLENVATSTAMQIYLDNYSSRGADFNENYARELIELHTLGVVNYFGPGDPFEVPCLQTDIHCPGTVPAGYVDNDVYEAAAALTGWTIKSGYWQYPADNDGGFIYRADWHDRRNKIFMGLYIPPNNQPAMQDGRSVFDRLVAHPGTAKHIATKMCRRFVGDAPSAALINAVALDFASNINAPDQIARMLRTILTSAEFKQSWGGGMKRPFEATMGGLRGLAANFTPLLDNTANWTLTKRFLGQMQLTGHRSFFWNPPNGYPDRQSAWASTGSLAMTLKMLAWLPEMRINNDSTSALISDVAAQTAAAFPTVSTRTAAAIMGFWCDRLLGHRPEPVYGVVTNFLQQNATATEVIDITTDAWNTGNLKLHYTQRRLRTAVSMILMSADYFRR